MAGSVPSGEESCSAGATSGEQQQPVTGGEWVANPEEDGLMAVADGMFPRVPTAGRGWGLAGKAVRCCGRELPESGRVEICTNLGRVNCVMKTLVVGAEGAPKERPSGAPVGRPGGAPFIRVGPSFFAEVVPPLFHPVCAPTRKVVVSEPLQVP